MSVGYQIRSEMKSVEHPQAEQIELDDSDGRTVILVPLQDRPSLHPTPLDWNDLMKGPVGDDHATGVNPEMTRKPVQPLADVIDEFGGQTMREGRLHPQLGGIAAVDVLRQTVHLGLCHPEDLADISQHRPGPIGDDVGHHGRSLSPIAPEAVLDDLLSTISLQIEIDVRRSAALF